MFITSFGEQNITYKCCSNFLIHLFPPIAPTSSTLYAWFRTLHGILAWLLFAVVIGHLSAALLHAWIYRDGVFSSMALGSSAGSNRDNEKKNAD